MTPAPMLSAGASWRRVATAGFLFLSAMVSRCVAADDVSLLAPAEVVRAVEDARRDVVRTGLPPLDLSVLLRPLGDPEPDPPTEWIYRNPLVGPLARAVGGVEGRFQEGLRRLAQGSLEEAAEVFAEIREKHAKTPRAGDAAFWVAEIRRRQSRIDEAAYFLRLVSGPREQEATYRLGRLLHFQGRTGEAASLWEGLARNSESPFRTRAAVARGVFLLLGEDLVGAREVFQKVLSGPLPSGPEGEARYSALLPLALAHQRLGELAAAQRAVLALLLERPDHPAAPHAHLVLGWFLLEEGRPGEALRRFSDFLATGWPASLSGSARLGLALAQIDLGKLDEAEPVFSTPGLHRDWLVLGRSLMVWARLQQGDPSRGLLGVHRPAGDSMPAFPLSAHLAGECLRLVGRDPEAEVAYDGIAKSAAIWPAAMHGKVLLALKRSEWSAVAERAGTLLKWRPDYSDADRIRVLWAEALMRLGRLERARSLAESVAHTGRASGDGLLLRGAIAAARSRWGEAAALFGRFVAEFPRDPRCDNALLGRARAEFGREASLTALDVLDTLERRSPVEEVRFMGVVQRAQVLASLDRDREARGLLEAELGRAAHSSSRDALVQQGLGMLEAKAGHCEAAVVHFTRALALSPSTDVVREVRLGLAQCLLRLNRAEEALREFQSLEASADVLYGQGLCFAKLSRLDELLKVGEVLAAITGPGSDPRVEELGVLLGQGRLAQGLLRLTEGDDAQGLVLLEAAARSPGEAGLEAMEAIARHREKSGPESVARDAWDRLAAASPTRACRALRAAASLAARLGDVTGASERLVRAVQACPLADVAQRQSILADLGALEARAGNQAKAVEFLRAADVAGFGGEGLRALLVLAEVQENAGRGTEALETRLRIGYVYGVGSPVTAESLLRAAKQLDAAGRTGRARALYRRLAEEAQGPPAVDAKNQLARAAANLPERDLPSPLPPPPSSR